MTLKTTLVNFIVAMLSSITIVGDTVIIAVGMMAKAVEADQFREITPDFIPIGDCEQATNVKHAIRSGYNAAIQL